ncbi:hypothetical protein ABBQ38_007171 [Trebouxia sp. C0009 RCD-2024]
MDQPALVDLVETALQNEDIAPLVRYVFENAVELASVPATSQDPRPSVEGVPQTAGTATQPASEPALQIDAVAQDVLTALYSVEEAQGNEVAAICRFT